MQTKCGKTSRNALELLGRCMGETLPFRVRQSFCEPTTSPSVQFSQTLKWFTGVAVYNRALNGKRSGHGNRIELIVLAI